MIAPLILLLLLLTLAIWIGLAGKQTVPPAHDKMGVVYVLSVFVPAVCILSAWNGCLILRLINVDGATTLRAISFLLLLLPFFLLIVAYSLLPVISLRYLKNEPDSDSALAVLVEDLARQMSIERDSFRFICSKMPGFSPHVLGTAWGKPTLVVPEDFSEMCRTACVNDNDLTESLMKLVLSHELAHIKSRDLLWLPLVWLWKYAFIPCAVISLILKYAFTSNADVNLSLILGPMTTLLGASLIIVGFLLRLSIKARELFADTYSSLCVAPQVVRKLILAGEGELSPIERFMFNSTSWIALPFSFLGYNARRVNRGVFDFSEPLGFWKTSQTMRSFRKETDERVINLKNKVYLFPAVIAGAFSNVWAAGITAALVFFLGSVAKLTVFSGYFIKGYPLTSAGWWTASSEYYDSGLNAFMSVDILTSGMVGLASSSILLVPLRESFASIVNLNRKKLFVYLSVLVIVLAIFSFASSFITLRSEYPLFSFQRMGKLPSQLSIVGMYGIILLIINARWSRVSKYQKMLFKKMFPQVFLTFAVWGLAVFLFRELHYGAGLLLVLTGAMLWGFLTSLFGWGRRITYDEFIEEEWFDYKKVLTLKRIRIGSVSQISRQSKLFDVMNIMAGLVNHGLPAFLITALAYPSLVIFDGWFYSNVESLHQQFLAISDNGPEGNWFYSLWLSWIFIVNEPKGIPVTIATLIPICLIFNVLSLTSVFIPMTRYDKGRRVIRIVTILHKISSLLDVQLVSYDLNGRFKKACDKMFSENTHIQTNEGIPLMGQTSEVLLLADSMLADDESRALQWVKSCSCSTGGYSYTPEQPPDLLHTFSGISVCLHHDSMGQDEKDLHLLWLDDQCSQLLSSASLAPEDVLQYAYFIVSSIRSLDSNWMPHEKEMFFSKLHDAWVRSAKRIDDGFHYMSALRLLSDSESVEGAVGESWIDMKEQDIIRLDPKSSLDTIWKMLKVLSIAYPDEYLSRAGVLRMIDNLKSVYGKGERGGKR